MTGDLSDIVSRLWSVLPKHWFAYDGPNINAVLRSIATPWTWIYSLIAYGINQTRISSATDSWLDLIALDYFGPWLNRKPNESDMVYLARIKAALMREGVTRSAISASLTSLVGSQPEIFEPGNCLDTGSYGVQSDSAGACGRGLAYGQAGGWGSLTMPMQVFVTVSRPPTPGVAMLAGYGSQNCGYGEGAVSYLDLNNLPGQITDSDIQTILSGLLPVNVVAWLQVN